MLKIAAILLFLVIQIFPANAVTNKPADKILPIGNYTINSISYYSIFELYYVLLLILIYYFIITTIVQY